MSGFPAIRPRRNRKSPWTRRLVAENTLTAADLILPIILVEGEKRREPVASMPGFERLSIDLAVEQAAEAAALGIPALALFPSIAADFKTDDGREALRSDNLIGRGIARI